MEKNARIYVASNDSLVKEPLLRELARKGYKNIVGKSGSEPPLGDAQQVDAFFSSEAPEYVFLLGGRSGGIRANQKYPADLMLDNLLVGCHVVASAHRYGAKKLLYLASSCIYPKLSQQPMRVELIMSGRLEPTNEAYALAKLAGVYLCQAFRQQFGANFITAVPANAFGPGDDFSQEDSHVVGALLRRMHEAKVTGREYVEIWGSGMPRREFIFSEDLAKACLFLMRVYDQGEPINVGVGYDWSIGELAEQVKGVVDYAGELRFDNSKPDGMPAKLLDSTQLKSLGWKPETSIKEALGLTYEWFLRAGAFSGQRGERAVL